MPRDRIRAEIKKIGPDETFTFNCHPGVSCFTDCCRSLELALSPYDVSRLCSRLAMTAAEFLDRYAMVAMIPEESLPQVMLAMNETDDRCPFVSSDGCRVYPDRPAACRAYPLGRGINMAADKTIAERYVVLHEDHCHGFIEATEQTPRAWFSDQGLEPYNRAADLLYRLRSKAAARGLPLSDDQINSYLRALYLDPASARPPATEERREDDGEEDLEPLKIRINKIAENLFNDV